MFKETRLTLDVIDSHFPIDFFTRPDKNREQMLTDLSSFGTVSFRHN